MEKMKETNIVRLGCGIFIVYILILLGALMYIALTHLQPSSWFEVKPIPKKEQNGDSLLRVRCDSLGIDYNTIGTTTDPD
jgi:hypothetical protein